MPHRQQPDPIRRLLVMLVLVTATGVAGIAYWQHTRPQDSGFPILRLGGDFTLTGGDNRPFRLTDQRGQVVLLAFGFTHCPDVCPLTLARFRAVRAALGPDAARTRMLLVTVDPTRDTPAVMGRYVRYFDPHLIGLSGAPSAIAAVARQYGVTALTRPDGQVAHSDYLYLIDARGRLRKLHDQQAGVDVLVADLRRLLREAR